MIPAYQLTKVLSDLRLQGSVWVTHDEVREYANGRANVLAGIALAGERGYAEALDAEATNVTLFVLGKEIDMADDRDVAMRQTIKTLLAIAVRMLV